MLRTLLREGSRFRSTVRVSMLVAALGAAAGLASAQDSGRAPGFEGLKRLDLPREIVRASDVRWLADGEIVLGVIGSGIHAWRLGEKGAELRVALEDPAPEVLEIGGRAVVNRNTFERDYGRLGSSPQGLAFADLFGGVFLANESGIDGPVDIKFLGDLDRRGARTAAVGLMLRDADGWAPYAAWLIEDGSGPPSGLLPTRDGGRGLELCRDAELSVTRFISEGRLLVIPGAEAGVFIYDVDGALHDSLDAAVFFAESGCDLELNRWGSSPLSDAYQRADWLGPRRIIDEVVADGAGNVYFFVRYGAERPAEEPGAEIGSLPDFGPRAIAADIAATLPNTDAACPTPHCYEPATPGWAPATSAYHWRPAPRWRAEGSRRRPSIHHVALRASQRAVGFNRQRPVSVGPGRQRAQEPAVQPRGRAGVPGGSVRDLVVAAVPPPSGRVCWDLVHARVDDLRTVARQPCVVESEFADTRLRADLRGDRVVILLRGGALRGGDVRAAEAFEARLLPPAGAEG
ncbi:MAG: hypothetical protein F4060_11580 [Holophagales bacterium]|nr:hypothetical protein [Holophagales bacterium]MYG29112.1 hypothetical protein [Holophagales bacterium]MYI80568.1 hypothetical protein [Holophagales bacterium]